MSEDIKARLIFSHEHGVFEAGDAGMDVSAKEAFDRITALEVALAFYADEARWIMNSAGVTPAMDDRGHRARQALLGVAAHEPGIESKRDVSLTSNGGCPDPAAGGVCHGD